MIDASAVARVVGVETKFQDMRAGGILFLPQRVAIFAQGSSDAVYSSEKWRAPSAGAGGTRFGFGSMIHLILRELMPANGDGLGTVEVTVYPLSDAPGSVAAVGDITPSGTAVKAGSYRVRIGGVLSEPFVIPAGPVDVAAVNAAIGAAVRSILEMPVTVSHTYGAPEAAPAAGNVGNGTLTAFTVTGTPVPGTWTLRVNQAVANGGVFTLSDPSGTAITNGVTMTPGVGTATPIATAGLSFTLTDGSTNFAVGDAFTLNVVADDVIFTAKWKGPSGNAIKIEVLGESLGVVFATTQPTGGLVNPSVGAAIAQIGSVWETMVINGLPIEETAALDAFQAFGEGRWLDTVAKPLIVFTGNTHPTVAQATAIASARRDDRVNAQLVAPASPNLPCVVAARQVARIASLANNNPPTDYGSQRATGLIPGPDRDQWDYIQRDQAVKLGSSTIEVKDGVINISDVVTFYRPTGEEPPAYRYVKDIVRLQQVLYNVSLVFNGSDWDGAPLLPDDQPTVNPRARKPRTAKAQAAAICESLGLNAVIADPEWSKKNIQAQINPQNPNRLDLMIPIKLSGNTNVKAIEVRWGFYYGTAAVVG